MRKKDQVHQAIETCLETYGQIDCFVANAGISIPSLAQDYDASVFEETYQTNVLGALYGFEKVIPHFLKRDSGHIVSISSLASYRGLPGAGAYSSSKAALSTLTESLRIDLRDTKTHHHHTHSPYANS